MEGCRALAPFALEGASDQITIAPHGARLAYVLQNLDANIWRLPLDRIHPKNSPPPEKLFASVREEMDPAVRRSHRTGSRSRSSRTGRDIGTHGFEPRTVPGYVSLRRNLSCHSIPHGLQIAVKSPLNPRRSARVRSG
jgi:hypothetical protein